MTVDLISSIQQFALVGFFGPFVAVWIAMILIAVWRAYWA